MVNPMRLCLAFLLLLCLSPLASAIDFTEAELATARALQNRLLTLDTHLDTPANFSRPDFNIMHRHDQNAFSQVDYPRMVEGALDGGFWAIFTGQGERTRAAHLNDRDKGLQRLLDIREMLAANPQHFELALTADDAARIKAAGKRVVYISMENANPLVADPTLLSFYYQAGLRLMSTVHVRNNEFADSSTDTEEWGGLSPAGKALVDEAVRLGIMIDHSHASDAVFDDLIERMPVPFILSHSAAKDMYAHPRNLDDQRLKQLAAKGGVIQLNAFGGYLVEESRSAERQEVEREIRERIMDGADWNTRTMAQGAELGRALAELDLRIPRRRASLDDLFVHFDHLLNLIGPDHVGIGLDWDGGGGVSGLDEVSALPKITAWLQRRGLSEEEIGNIWSGNVLRVMRAVEAHAASGR